MARRLTAEQARKLKAKASDGKPVGLREVKAARPAQETPVAPEPKPQADGMPDLVEAIREMVQVQGRMPVPPAPNIEVQPAPVTVQQQPAPEPWKHIKVTVERDPHGRATAYNLKRVS